MSTISTHVLDTAAGMPAEGVGITLDHVDGSDWVTLADLTTDGDGRVTGLAPSGELTPGTYRLTFHVGEYYATRDINSFYPYAQVVFTIQPDQVHEHFHVPLLTSPFGYSTYRGS